MMTIMSSRDLVEAMGAKNTRSAIARAMRADPDAARALKAEQDAIAAYTRVCGGGAAPAERQRAYERVQGATARRVQAENGIRRAWGMPLRKE